jgi:hypothetical protein
MISSPVGVLIGPTKLDVGGSLTSIISRSAGSIPICCASLTLAHIFAGSTLQLFAIVTNLAEAMPELPFEVQAASKQVGKKINPNLIGTTQVSAQ